MQFEKPIYNFIRLITIWATFFLIINHVTAQNYANGSGKGSLQKEVFWLTWNNGLVTKPANATNNNITEGVYEWSVSPTVRVLATISNIVSISANCKLASYTSGSFYADGLDDLYPGVVGSGIITSVFGGQVKFNISATVQVLVNNIWQDIAYPGLVIGDAESMASGEFIKASTNSSDGWQLLDLRNDAFPKSKADNYLFTLSNSSRNFKVALDPSVGDDIFVQAVLFAKGANQLTDVEMKGRGSASVAIGLVVPADFGDAPASFGNAGNMIDKIVFSVPPTIADGQYPITSIQKASLSTQASVYMGINNVDADGAAPNSVDANYDDTSGVNDENGFILFNQPTIKVNTSGGINFSVNASNTKAVPANLFCWVDFNGDGLFGVNEGISVIVPANTINQSYVLTFANSSFSSIIKAGTNYVRFRITTSDLKDDIATDIDERSIGAALDGETEDYKLNDKLGISIAGTVYDDSNGLSDGLINGLGIGTVSSQQLYAYLLDDQNTVVLKTVVAANGKYQFANCNNGAFTVIISVNNVAVGGDIAEVVADLPQGWMPVGDAWGINNLAGSGLQTGTPNLQTAIKTPTNSLDITALNFGINKKPVANNDSVKTIIGVAVPIGAPANDLDFENALDKTTVLLIDPADGIKKTTVAVPNVGIYTVNPSTGIVTFTPAVGFVGKAPDIFYTIKDKAGLESDAAVLVVWVYPVGVNDTDNTFLNSQVTTNVKANDGVSGNNSTVQVAQPPANGSVLVNPDGTITYTPNPGYSGKDTYTYTLTTPDGLTSAPIMVNINVSALPKPSGVPDIDTTIVNTPIIVPVKNNDGASAIGSTLSIGTNPINGSVKVNPDGTITYTPSNGYVGKDSLYYILTNAEGVSSSPIKVIVYVKPTGVNDADFTPVNTPITTVVKANDGPSGLNTTVSINSNPTNGTVKANADGTVTYTPKNGYIGKDTYTYVLTSKDGVVSSPITVNISVLPIGVNDTDKTPVNTPVTTMVKANDGPSGLSTTVNINSNPTSGTVKVNADGTVTYTPNNGFVGKDMYTYVLTSSDGVSSAPITVTVTVNPVGVNDVDKTPINTPVTTTVKANDGPSGLNTTVNINSNPTNGTVKVNDDGTVTYTPNNGFVGKDTYTYVLTSSDGVSSAPITVTVTVNPVGVNDTDKTPINTPVTTKVKANDGPSGLNTTVNINSNPTNGTVKVNADGTVTYTPNNGFVGKDTYTYVLTTADGVSSAPITVTVSVLPVGVNDTDNTPVNTPVTTTVKANDGPSGLTTTVSINENPTNGSVKVNADGTVTYTPNNGFTGIDTYTYVLTTPDGVSSAPITVSVNVSPINKSADVRINKQMLTPAPINIGSDASFSIVVTNDGPSDATGVMVYDLILPNLDLPRTIIASQGTAKYNAITKSFEWTVGNLDKGKTAEITFMCKVIGGGELANAANVTANESDPDLSNNISAITKLPIIESDIFIPNVITPNGDGKNDFFVIKGLTAYPGSSITIFNRWDNMVYQSESYQNNWDGKGLSNGTYFYVLKLRKNGNIIAVKKGWIELLR